MKKSELRQIIREEIQKLQESDIFNGKNKDFSVVIEKDLTVVIDIDKNDSVDKKSIVDKLGLNLKQHSWGYEFQLKNKSQIKPLLQILKVK